ncbi:MAG: alpha/beta hydrolase [Beijerinckiaceae bacterium]|nr:alpha/beta hydrolase [Beijerinckiaceae bacterium]
MAGMMHVKTSAGRVAVRVSTGARTPMLFLHGNSMSSEAFDALMNGPLARSYRFIAADLPGHGASDNATAPEKTYTLAGYADAMLDVLFALDAPGALVCVWSLGGHIALEMMARSSSVAGAIVVGAPPVTPGQGAIAGFTISDILSLLAAERLDQSERATLAHRLLGPAPPEFALRALERADGRARPILAGSIMQGEGADPAGLLASGERPVALVCGEREPLVSWDFMRAVQGPALWRGAAISIADAGHAPFLDAPAAFSNLLLQFIRDAAGQARAPSTRDEQAGRRLSA